MIDLRPKVCNLCGGKVEYTSNAVIYGREYGSGMCYYCKSCGAYVGTHKPRPWEALGLLADEPMRKGKMACHSVFDAMWKGKPKAQKKRKDLYLWLAGRMGIPVSECHFGWFNIQQLMEAYAILLDAERKEMKYDNNGRIYFEKRGAGNGQG